MYFYVIIKPQRGKCLYRKGERTMSEVIKGSAATRAKNKWQAANCDRINLVIPKGRKDAIQAVARATGESLNGFVSTAIDERIARLDAPEEERE